MKTLNWGIIGCGDVAEVKSGPAFQKSANSSLLAVMRRNGEKAKDFALRHGVANWYDNAELLLRNPEINAVYISTPPASHLKYALQALEAGKDVYLEKPMAISAKEARVICEAVKSGSNKLTVAHYRRRLPAFMKVKELLGQQAVGKVRFADIQILQPPKSGIIAKSEVNWRTDPEVSGGGYFHDIAPHQIDLMLHFFGEYQEAAGFSGSQESSYAADDIVNGAILFKNKVQLRGVWAFNVAEQDIKDQCIIYGSEGSIQFSFYGEEVQLISKGKKESFSFENPPHVQQPMIEATTSYFLGSGPNPCPAEEGLLVMHIMDKFCGNLG